jgi:hypothetical protein
MRHLFGLIALLAIVTTQPALARPLERELPLNRSACWERIYDAAHLSAHPRQKVAEIRLVHIASPGGQDPAGLYLQLYFNLRERRANADAAHDFKYGGFCKPVGRALRCEAEWEAGTFTVEAGAGGLLVRNGGIVANPLEYDAEDIADGAVKIPAKPDDGAWSLKPARGECRIE